MNSETFSFTFALAATTICFLIYHFFVYEKVHSKELIPKTADLDNVRPVIQKRIWGGIILGLLPLTAALLFTNHSMTDLGFSAQSFLRSIPVLAVLCALILLITFLTAKSPANLSTYPEIKNKSWPISLLVLSSGTWIFYLAGYEVLFRGILFTSSLSYMDLVPSVALNACIYALVHVPKGARETFGALLYGTIICYFTYTTNGIWVALISHITLALSNEWFSIYYQIKKGNLEIIK